MGLFLVWVKGEIFKVDREGGRLRSRKRRKLLRVGGNDRVGGVLEVVF